MKNSERPPEDSSSEIVLDHRSLARFDGLLLTSPGLSLTEQWLRYQGDAPEPRPGLSSGHIPNSLPCPFNNYLSPANDDKPYTSFRPPPELKRVLVDAVGGQKQWSEVANGDRGLIFSCGSGMSAAVGWLANEVIRAEEGGKMKSAIYDEVGEHDS